MAWKVEKVFGVITWSDVAEDHKCPLSGPVCDHFRLLDDDGNVYMQGVTDMPIDDMDEDAAFALVDYYMYQLGVTELQYKDNWQWRTL